MTQSTNSTAVLEANQRMQSAWELGHEVIQKIGERAAHGAMHREFGGNASYAEKLRKYRGMASVITEAQLRDICRRCIKADRPWGAQFLVELSRLPDRKMRESLSIVAIDNHWGLSQLKRHIRLELGQQDRAKANTGQHAGVGRKRKLDWSDERQVLDEVSHLCVTWMRFNEELQSAINTPEGEKPIGSIAAPIRTQLGKITKEIQILQAKSHERINQLKD